MIASVDGSTLGGAGTSELIDELPGGDSLDAAIVLSQPGAANPKQPLLVSSSAGTESASAQLVETAAALLATAGDSPTSREGALGGLARLAFPTGLGEQAPLIADGVDSVALSSAGESPLPADDDQEADLGPDSIALIGRTAIALVGAVDQSGGMPDHGPGTYVNFAGNLIPGWSLALLALVLLLPPAAVAAEELARQSRRRAGLGPIAVWMARCALPPLAGLLAIYALALVGLIPSPPFPFDPGAYGIGGSEVLALAFLLALIGGVAFFERIWRVPPGAGRQPLAAIGGGVAVIACLIAWAQNPYLALLLAPLAHVWVGACRRPRRHGLHRRDRTPLRDSAACRARRRGLRARLGRIGAVAARPARRRRPDRPALQPRLGLDGELTGRMSHRFGRGSVAGCTTAPGSGEGFKPSRGEDQAPNRA